MNEDHIGGVTGLLTESYYGVKDRIPYGIYQLAQKSIGDNKINWRTLYASETGLKVIASGIHNFQGNPETRPRVVG